MSTLSSFNWFCAFLVAQFQSNLIDAITPYGVYFTYASMCAVAVAFVLLVLPETKGKSPEDMKLYFLGQSSRPAKSDGNENQAFENSWFGPCAFKLMPTSKYST